MSRISMHEIFKVAYWLLCLFFPYFLFTQTIFFSKYMEEKKRPYCRWSKSIPTLSLSFLIFPPPDPSVSPKRLRRRKYCPLCLFFPYFALRPNPRFSQKRLRKRMDVAQTHFGAALYRLCVMLCTFGACNNST
jgi:hypothetical protein